MSLTQRVLNASQGRDRVTDTVKALALTLVILGHGLAWTTLPDGTVSNTLDQAPNLYPLTWALQVLPLFFLLAGAGLIKQARNPTGNGLAKRIYRLATPTLPLLAITLIASTAIEVAGDETIAQAAGLLPIQLTWFIGVYLIVTALAPALVRMNTIWHYVAALAAIIVIDLARTHLWAPIGWANLIIVWAFFTSIGMHLDKLRTLNKWLTALGAVASLGAAAVAITIGPYSKALITTDALPGLSNLAPPTIVLALAGLGQIFILLTSWDALAKLLNHNRLWIPIAIFSTRAMSLYLYHMLALSMLIAAVLLSGYAPNPLGIQWWVIHVAVLAAAATAVWFSAPALEKLATVTAGALGKALPRPVTSKLTLLPVWAGTVWAAATGLNYLLMSESGLSQALEPRTVLGLPYLPLATLAVIACSAAIAHAAKTPQAGKTP